MDAPLDGYAGQPLLVAEFGGVALDVGGPYGKNPKHLLPGYLGREPEPKSKEEALSRIQRLTAEIYERKRYAGFCYTQLYDVEFEKNGLLTYDRRAKFGSLRVFEPRGVKRSFEEKD